MPIESNYTFFPGPICTPENVFYADILYDIKSIWLENKQSACLSCSFRGVRPHPGIKWFIPDHHYVVIAQENDNGTLLTFWTPEVPIIDLYCERENSTFRCELNIKAHCGWLLNCCASCISYSHISCE